MPSGLHNAISGILAGGSWVSAAWIVASALSDGHLVRCLVLFLLVRWPAQMMAHKLLSEFIKSSLLSNCPGFWCVSFACFLRVVFLFCLVLRFLWFTALGQLYGLCKGPHLLSFAAFPIDGIACFSQLITSKYKLVERPSKSHEGIGRKKMNGTLVH